jgi:MFS family permease
MAFLRPFCRFPCYLSDKLGRKPVIIFGMAYLHTGQFEGGKAKNIWFMVLARFIQGFGAVSSAMTALSADLTREEVRTRAFAFIGASHKLSFYPQHCVLLPSWRAPWECPLSFTLQPSLVFWLPCILPFFIPETKKNHHREIEPTLRNFPSVLKDRKPSLFEPFHSPTACLFGGGFHGGALSVSL